MITFFLKYYTKDLSLRAKNTKKSMKSVFLDELEGVDFEDQEGCWEII